MADATSPVSPAPAAPTAEAPKTHHSALQPRAPQGTFAGPPDASKTPPAPTAEAPPAPKSWKWGDKEITDPDVLYKEAEAARIAAQEKGVERQALADFHRRAAEAEAKHKALEAKLSNPRALLTPEQEEAILLERARVWAEEERIRALPPAQQEIIRAKQELDKQRRDFEAQKAAIEKQAADAKAAEEAKRQEAEDAAARQEMTAYAQSSLKAAGLEETADNYLRVTAIIRGGLINGVMYPPEVIGAKVRAKVAAEVRAARDGATVEDLTSEANLKKLAAIEDPAVLRKLAAVLGDKLRRINLAELGLSPVAVPKPAAGTLSTEEPDYPPGDPRWERYLREKMRR